MTGWKKAGIVSLTAIATVCGLDLGDEFSIPGIHGFISEVQARVGRPLTPVSVAGTARRTTRRVVRRTSIRVNVLPAGCPYGPYYGGYYYYCGGRYYSKEGNVYVVVVFD